MLLDYHHQSSNSHEVELLDMQESMEDAGRRRHAGAEAAP